MARFVKELEAKIERLRLDLEKTRKYAEALTLDLAAAERLYASEPRRGRKPKGRPPQLPPQSPPVGPPQKSSNHKNKTAIAIELISRPVGASPDDIWTAFQQHGLKVKKNYVFNILSRLDKKQQKVEKREDRYFWKRKKGTAVA